MNIEEGKVVTIHYTLTSDDGEPIDSSRGGDPLPYLHGAGNIVPGLEKALTGRSAGDTFEVKVTPAEGYGERSGKEESVPRNMFPEDAQLSPGMSLQATTQSGDVVQLWIQRVEADTVVVGEDHPLAGQHLDFAIEVVAIRDATDEEREQGHP